MVQARKSKINLNDSDEKILKKYKVAFPEASEEKLLENIRY